MKTDTIHLSLREIGLNEKEIDLYIAALQIGEAGMSELARVAGLKRTSAYLIFKSLEEKGLLGSFRTKAGQKFVAQNPKYLIDKAKKEMEAVSLILPELQAIRSKTTKKPKITYYEGAADYIRIVEEALHKPKITLRQIGSLSEGHKVLTKDYDLKHFVPRRIQQGIFLKAIFTPDSKYIFQNEKPTYLRDIKFLPDNTKVKTLTLIYEDKVIISTTKENLVVIVIESKEIADAEKEKFDFLFSLIK